MFSPNSRRRFLQQIGAASACAGIGDLAFLSQLPRVSAAEARAEANIVRLQPEIEPLVRLLEETPREKLLEEVASRIRGGVSYREVLAALLLAPLALAAGAYLQFQMAAKLAIPSPRSRSAASVRFCAFSAASSIKRSICLLSFRSLTELLLMASFFNVRSNSRSARRSR